MKNEKCLYTTDELNSEILSKTINIIHQVHGRQIEDTIDLMGLEISREEFEKNLNAQIKELEKHIQHKINSSDTTKIVEENQNKLDIDEILDKINKTGLNSLTSQELNFLKKFK